MYLSWRLLKGDAADVAFDVFRQADGGAAQIAQRRFGDHRLHRRRRAADGPLTYWVRASAGGRGGDARQATAPPARRTPVPCDPARDDVKSVDRVGIGDLNGDGAYDFVVKHPAGNIDPGRVRPSTDTYKLDAYDGRTGRFLWRVDLGWNINHGIWFSPMVVRDLDGDGKAEVAVRGAPYAATQAAGVRRRQGLRPRRARVARRSTTATTGKEIDKAPWIERGKLDRVGRLQRATDRAGTCWASPISTARRRACSSSAAPTG